MSDAVTTPAAESATPAVASPKKVAAKKASGAKKPATKPNHPPVAEMVNAAIAALKEKKGSSLQAIKKYIATQYKFDVEKQSTFIKKYLKSAVEKKILVQTKGSGAAGSFKLAEKAPKKAAAKKPAAKKPAAVKKAAVKKPAAAKKPVAKKPTAAKKPVAKKAPAKPKAAKPKSPTKAKKTGKAPAAAKPKVPKPKKAAAPKAKPAAKK